MTKKGFIIQIILNIYTSGIKKKYRGRIIMHVQWCLLLIGVYSNK